MKLAALHRWRPSRQRLPASRWRLTGLLAGVVLAATSWFCAAVPTEFPVVWPGVALWRPERGSPLACTVALLAVGAMLYAWWALRDLDVTSGWLVRTAAAWFAPLLLSAPLFSRDIYSYAAQGLMLDQGLDPYTHGVQALQSPWLDAVARTWLDTPAPYGPVFLVLARGAAALSGGHLLVALVLLRLLAVAGVLVMMWAVPAIARSLGVDPARAAWLGFLTPLVGGHLVSGGHNDALMVAGMLAGLALALKRRYLLSILAIAAAMTVKAPAVVVMPFVAILWAVDDRGAGRAGRAMTWSRVIRRSLLAGAATVAAFVAMSLATGLGFSWLSALATPGRSIQWTSVSTAWGSAVGALGHLAGVDLTDGAIAVSRAVALALLGPVLVGIWLHAVKHSHDRRVVCQSAGLALLAVVVLAPAFHGWYFLWALPVLAATTSSRRALTVLGGVAALLAVAVLPGGYGLALTTTSVGVPLMVLVSLVVLARAARAAATYPWGALLSLAEPPPDRQETKVIPEG